MEAEIDWLCALIASTKSPIVFCHNDVCIGNLIVDDPTGKTNYYNLKMLTEKIYLVLVKECTQYIATTNTPFVTWQLLLLCNYLEDCGHSFNFSVGYRILKRGFTKSLC